MNRLALARAGLGAAVLLAPDEMAGHVGDLHLSDGTRTAMRILGVRLLSESAVCAVRPTRCVLTLEAAVDVIHGTTMGLVAMFSGDASSRRAAAVNVASAAAFVVADVVAVRTHPPASRAEHNSVLRIRDAVADRLCRWSRLAQCL